MASRMDALQSGQNQMQAQLNKASTSSGEPNAISNSNLYVPPSAKLSKKLQQAIWDNKYVDFNKLLDKDEPGYDLTLNPKGGGSHSIHMEPREKAKITLPEWRKAFNLFQACYLKKFAPPL